MDGLGGWVDVLCLNLKCPSPSPSHTYPSQIVMLESSTDLFHHLQVSQITRDLGGTLDYDHDQWIQIQRVGTKFIHTPTHNCKYCYS